jgi:hypothetical protein
MKIKRIIHLITPICCALIFSGTIPNCNASITQMADGTQVGGIISNDTTWTKANSPYNLTGNVFVNKGVTLTIQAGVTVYLDGGCIAVNGTLNVRGNNDNKVDFITTVYHSTGEYADGVITFSSDSAPWNEQTQTGCIIENANINSRRQKEVIWIQDSSPKINHCSISTWYTAILIVVTNRNSSSTAPIISNNTITSTNEQGIEDGWGHTGGMTGTGSSAYIYNNYFYGCDIAIETIGGNLTIAQNLINCNTTNSIGIMVNACGSMSFPIQNNTFTGNAGIYFSPDSYPYLTTVNFKSGISGNNFENTANAIRTNQYPLNIVVNATNNWWGTSDTQAINQSVNQTCVVNFIPFLTAPNLNSPSTNYNPNPTPTPTPSPTPSPVPTDTPTPIPTPTSTSIVTPVPVITPQPTIAPIPTATPTPTPIPIPTPTSAVPELSTGVILLLLIATTTASFVYAKRKTGKTS